MTHDSFNLNDESSEQSLNFSDDIAAMSERLARLKTFLTQKLRSNETYARELQPNHLIGCIKSHIDFIEKQNFNLNGDNVTSLEAFYEAMGRFSDQILYYKSSLNDLSRQLWAAYTFDSLSLCTVAQSKLYSIRRLKYPILNESENNEDLFDKLEEKLRKALAKFDPRDSLRILNKFVCKMRTVISCLVTYVMKQSCERIVAHSPQLISLLDEFMRNIFGCFEFKTGVLAYRNQNEDEYFQRTQEKFDELCSEMQIPAEFIKAIECEDFFRELGAQMNRLDDTFFNLDSATQLSHATPVISKLGEHIEQLTGELGDLLSEASKRVEPRPNHLIVKIQECLVHLSAIKSDADLKRVGAEKRCLTDALKDYKKEVEELDTLAQLFSSETLNEYKTPLVTPSLFENKLG